MMKKLYLLLLLLGGFCTSIFSQSYLPSSQVFHVNEIRTILSSDGIMGWDGDIGFYNVPFEGTNSPGTIMASDLWLGTIHNGQLRLAAQTYGRAFNQFDFYPGPLRPNDGKPYSTDDLENFNRVWSVAGYEVSQHIKDWSDNSYSDHPIISIVGWPGRGNPYFKEVNGFDFPGVLQDAAPFYDRNGDGIYNAFDGDYPLPETVTPGVIPRQIIWMVNNDAAGPHLQSSGQIIGVEVQVTAWAFSSDTEPLLNNSIFVSKKIINRSGRDYTDFYAGIWTNLNIGCIYDDFIGSIPETNAYYGYNATAFDDGNCAVGGNFVPAYEESPPVQAVTLLNQPMTGFNLNYHPAFGSPKPKPGTGYPVLANEHFNYLTGKWKDGTPLTRGGSGYDPALQNPATSFAFPDNPNDPLGWSQVTANLPPYDVRGLGVVRFDAFKNGEVKTIDAVYSTHQDLSLTPVQKVNLLYDEIPRLQQWYDEHFASIQIQPHCLNDCVWPGDANGDGIADHFDLLAIGAGYDSLGPVRPGLKSWYPQEASDWGEKLPGGLDFKHLDANGDGHIDGADFEITTLNFGKFNDSFSRPDEYRQGADLFLTTSANAKDGVIQPEDGYFTITLRKNTIPDLAGIAFTLEFDTQFVKPDVFILQDPLKKCLHFENIEITKPENQAGKFHFALFRSGNNCPIDNQKLVSLIFRPKSEVPDVSTWFRFKNGRALLEDGTEIPVGGKDLQLYFLGHDLKEKAGSPPDLTIYPNPSDGVFYFRLDRQEVIRIRIFDATGKLLDVRPAFHTRDFMVDLRSYGAGVYFLEIQQDRRFVMKKVVVGIH